MTHRPSVARLMMSFVAFSFTACDRVSPSKPNAESSAIAETAKTHDKPPVMVANGDFTARPLFSAGEIPSLKASKRATNTAAFTWKGKHAFVWTGGKNPNGGITPSVEYEITVTDGEGGDDVTVHADGMQTMTRIIAGGVENGDTLSVGFKSCAADDMFHCPGIKIGDTVCTLEHEKDGVWLVFGKMGAPDGKTKKIHASR
jgi:Family of unknown function (DUF5991)